MRLLNGRYGKSFIIELAYIPWVTFVGNESKYIKIDGIFNFVTPGDEFFLFAN